MRAEESFADTLKMAMRQKCPRCHKGDLYNPGFMNLTLRNTCSECSLDLSKNDSADGPAVFLIFFLSVLLVPLALLLDALVSPPLWAILVFFAVISLGITVGLLRPIKAYVIALQYKHRSTDWE